MKVTRYTWYEDVHSITYTNLRLMTSDESYIRGYIESHFSYDSAEIVSCHETLDDALHGISQIEQYYSTKLSYETNECSIRIIALVYEELEFNDADLEACDPYEDPYSINYEYEYSHRIIQYNLPNEKYINDFLQQHIGHDNKQIEAYAFTTNFQNDDLKAIEKIRSQKYMGLEHLYHTAFTYEIANKVKSKLRYSKNVEELKAICDDVEALNQVIEEAFNEVTNALHVNNPINKLVILDSILDGSIYFTDCFNIEEKLTFRLTLVENAFILEISHSTDKDDEY